MEQKKSISITVLTALFLLCLLAMSIQSMVIQDMTPENAEFVSKDSEIASLKNEIEMLKAEKELKTAGIGSAAVNVLVLLLFSASAGILSAYYVKRKTRSLCHCNNRRLKLMKKISEDKLNLRS
ncbi:MAG TPA: hypothetical protein PKE39_00865 [Ignavibacteria bacterium]|nr:hypothetical protein [Ignavibacteria bacterium]HMQ97546.1 hypothetical protein [Ignavibacteria bacterium]